jgi:hypothetical protein
MREHEHSRKTPLRSRVPSGLWLSGEAMCCVPDGRTWLERERSAQFERFTALRKRKKSVELDRRRRSCGNEGRLNLLCRVQASGITSTGRHPRRRSTRRPAKSSHRNLHQTRQLIHNLDGNVNSQNLLSKDIRPKRSHHGYRH